MINAKLYPETDFFTAENAIKAELKKIINSDFSDRELTKVKNKSLSTQLFSKMSVLNICMELAYYELLESAEYINSIEDRIMNVTKADIRRVASEIFRETNLSCVYYKSKS